MAAAVVVGTILLVSACSGSLAGGTTSTHATTSTTSTHASSTTPTSAPSTPESPTSASTQPTTAAAPSFDVAQAMAHVEKLSVGIGMRHAGTEGEMAAVRYEQGYLEGLGYTVEIQDVPIPNGLTSHNVVAVKQGTSPLTIVVGAHTDSRGPSPGANDNASGVGTVLELARALKDVPTVPTLKFVLFGNEEMIDQNPDHHHYGSRAFVARMSAAERAELVGMVSLDMVAVGSRLTVRTMGKGPQELRALLETYAASQDVRLTYQRDSSSTGWSDHEPFERAGFPAVWLEWQLDNTYHTAADTFQHVSSTRLQMTGDIVLGFLLDLTPKDLQRLADARTGQ